MNMMCVETLGTMFGNEALASEDVFPFTEKIFDAIRNDNVDIVVFHSTYELGKYNLLQSEAGGFGRFARLRTGERLFCRVRSFFGTSEAVGRALLPMQYGETREITVLIASVIEPLKLGSLKVVVASWITNETPDAYHGTPPAEVRSPSQSVYGMSVAPFVLLDNFVGRSKKTMASIGGYEAMFCGSTTLLEEWCSVRNCALKTSVIRGIASYYFAEWCVGVQKRSKLDLSVVYECSKNAIQNIASRSIVKMHKTLEEKHAHPDSNAPTERILEFSEAHRLSNAFFEHGTLAAMVDLLARGTFTGVNLSVFASPLKFPLYLTACVFLSAFPEIARLPNTGKSHVEDEANAATLIRLYRSLTTGHDYLTGQPSTAIEAILAVACDGLGITTTCGNQQQNNSSNGGKITSVYSNSSKNSKNLKSSSRRAAESEEINHIPYAIENMRRQGAALLQELFGHDTDAVQYWAVNKHASEMPAESLEAAALRTFDPITRVAVAERRQAFGCTGSSNPAFARSLRRSSRSSMQQVVLDILLEVNQFATDGTFRMCRFAAQNTAAEEVTHGAPTGIRRNASACRAIHLELTAYFTNGVSVLIHAGIPRVFCIRPHTRIKCGDCGRAFDPLSLICRDVGSLCEKCDVLFCIECYHVHVQKIIKASRIGVPTSKTIDSAIFEGHKHVMMCAHCTRHPA